MKKFRKTFAVLLSCVMTLSTCMVSFAEEPILPEDTTVAEEADQTENVELIDDYTATDSDALEELETFEIDASIEAYFDVPYISTYYFNPKPTVNDNIKIPIYITDSEQSEYMKNDTSKKLDLIYEVDGQKKTITNLPLGDYTLELGKLSAGTHTFTLQVVDNTTGMKSHKLFNDLWVRTGNETVKTYKMTTSDLTTYKIKNNGSENATDCINTRNGLTKLFEDKSKDYDKIILLPGTYRVDCERPQNYSNSSEPYYIVIPTNFTVDLNQSTIKLKTITTDIEPGVKVSGLMFKMDDAIDSHIINGTIEGDRVERQKLGLEVYDDVYKIFKAEQVMTIQMMGGKYCSLDNLTIKNTDGYTVGCGGVQGKAQEVYSFKNEAIINGQVIATDKCSSTDMVDLNKVLRPGDKAIYVGHYLGYRGLKGDSPIVYVSFYDENQKFIETITGYQYRMINVPASARYVRATILGTTDKMAFVSERYGKYYEVKNIKFEDTRTCALVPTACNNMLIENCTYTRCGNSITPLAVDMEDGWEECQDIYYRNNVVLEAAGTATLVDCSGFNHVYENNIGHDIEIRSRANGVVIKGNHGNGSGLRWILGPKTRSSYCRVYDNECGKVQFIDGTGNNTCAQFVVKDSTFRGTKGVTTTWVTSLADKVTFENCTFPSFAGSGVTMRNCTIQPADQLNDKLYFYDCTFKVLDGSSDSLNFNFTIPYNSNGFAERVFNNCKFVGKTNLSSNAFHSATFKGCEFDDVYINATVYDAKTSIIFDGCTMNSTSDNFLHLGPWSKSKGYIDLQFKNCNITHKGSTLIYFDAKPMDNSQILFDHCTIDQSSGNLTKWYRDGNLTYMMNDISADIKFKDTSINKNLVIDDAVATTLARITFEGTNKKNGLLTESGKIYYYINDVKQTGWQTVSGKKYYFGSDGAAKTGLQTISSKKYYFNTSGVMQTGWQTISNKKYYFGTDGAMQTGWQTIGSKKYYLGTDGVMVTGTVTIDSKKYEFGTDGVFVKEIVAEPEKDPEPEPELKNGFVEESGKTYYYVDDVKQLGWKKIDSVWYYFGADGAMATKKWVPYSGDWYYFNADGTMATNKWVAYSGDWYYFGSNGIMATNKWVSYKGDWYYFGDDGAMATDKWIAYKGDWYYFGADGVMVTTKWVLYKDKWYYFGAAGIMVTGTQTINGKQYTFNSNGVWVK